MSEYVIMSINRATKVVDSYITQDFRAVNITTGSLKCWLINGTVSYVPRGCNPENAVL